MGKTIAQGLLEYSHPSGECQVWTGQLNHNGYGQFSNHSYGTLLVHKIVWEQVNGVVPTGYAVDHKCLNRTCHKIEHLRLATKKQNAENMSGLRTDNTSGYRGVSRSGKNRWRAMVTHNGKQINAGTYECRHTAGEASTRLRLKLFSHNEIDRRDA